MKALFEGFADFYRESARLTILQGLAQQTDYRLSDAMLCRVLQAAAINKGRDFVRTELAWLHDSAGAVRLYRIGDTIVAEITEAGLDHVGLRRELPGVQRPGPAGG